MSLESGMESESEQSHKRVEAKRKSPSRKQPKSDSESGVDNEIDARMLGRIHRGDCVAALRDLPPRCIDLVFADPPFNIGFSYDVYQDRLQSQQYVDWSRQWMGEVHRVLKNSGSFWLAIGDEYAAELKIAAMELGFHCRSWVIWYYTFGVHCKYKFTRSHAHLFHFVKDEERFKFNVDAIRVPSARQLVYADLRANSSGRMPDDTWVLRPQDLVDGFTPSEDVWYIPRVAGTFKERAGFHGCQMPEQLLGRIIRCCSDADDVVMDPFSGSSTTVAVAKKLYRRWLSFELSEDYVKLGTSRLEAITPGDPLDGSAEPKVSAPTTANGKSKLIGAPAKGIAAARGSRKAGSANDGGVSAGVRITLPCRDPGVGFAQGSFDFHALADQDEQLIEAFAQACDGYSLDRVIADPALNEDLQRCCDRSGIAGTPAERNRQLFRLRVAGRLSATGLQTQQRTLFTWQEQADYRFASEIAWRRLSDEHPQRTLDELLCHPRTAEQFDLLAARYCPGYRPLEYRWAALTLRRQLQKIRKRVSDDDGLAADGLAADGLAADGLAADGLAADGDAIGGDAADLGHRVPLELSNGIAIGSVIAKLESLPQGAAVYAIGSGQDEIRYAGESDDLRRVIAYMFATAEQRRLWDNASSKATLWFQEIERGGSAPLVQQAAWVRWLTPCWNVMKWVESD